METTKVAKVVPLTFRSDKDLLMEVEKLKPNLDIECIEWDVRLVAMQKLEGLVLGARAAGVSGLNLGGILRPLMDNLCGNLHDGRSRVVRQVCHLIGMMAETMQTGFDSCAEVLLPDLLKLVPQSVAVMSDSANEAILLIIRHCHPNRLLPRILREIRISRSAAVRSRCSEYIHHALLCWGHSSRSVFAASVVDDIEAFIGASVNDGTREVRAVARQCFREFCKIWHAREDALRSQFDAGVLKVLAQEDKAMNVPKKIIHQNPTVSQELTAGAASRGPSPSRTRSPQPILSKNAVNPQQLVSLQQAAQAMAKKRRQSAAAALGTLHPLVPAAKEVPRRTVDDHSRNRATHLVDPPLNKRNGNCFAQPLPQERRPAEEPAVAAGGKNRWRISMRGEMSPSRRIARILSGGAYTRGEDSPSRLTPPNRALHALFDRVVEEEGCVSDMEYISARAKDAEQARRSRSRGKSLGGDALSMFGLARSRKLAENLGLDGVSLSTRHGSASSGCSLIQAGSSGRFPEDAKAEIEAMTGESDSDRRTAVAYQLEVGPSSIRILSEKGDEENRPPSLAASAPVSPLRGFFPSKSIACERAPAEQTPKAARTSRGGGSPLRALIPNRIAQVGASPLRLFRRDHTSKAGGSRDASPALRRRATADAMEQPARKPGALPGKDNPSSRHASPDSRAVPRRATAESLKAAPVARAGLQESKSTKQIIGQMLCANRATESDQESVGGARSRATSEATDDIMTLSDILLVGKRKEDWASRVKALTSLRTLIIKHGQIENVDDVEGASMSSKHANNRAVNDLIKNLEQVLEMVASCIDFQNHKVAGTALSCLIHLLNHFRDSLDGQLDKYLAPVLVRAVDPKQLLKDLASQVLDLTRDIFPTEAVLSSTDRVLERIRNAKAKARAVEFGNSIVDLSVKPDGATAKMIRLWGQRMIQLATEDPKMRPEAVKGAVRCTDIAGMQFMVLQLQGLQNSVHHELIACISKQSPELGDKVTKALREVSKQSGFCTKPLPHAPEAGPGKARTAVRGMDGKSGQTTASAEGETETAGSKITNEQVKELAKTLKGTGTMGPPGNRLSSSRGGSKPASRDPSPNSRRASASRASKEGPASRVTAKTVTVREPGRGNGTRGEAPGRVSSRASDGAQVGAARAASGNTGFNPNKIKSTKSADVSASQKPKASATAISRRASSPSRRPTNAQPVSKSQPIDSEMSASEWSEMESTDAEREPRSRARWATGGGLANRKTKIPHSRSQPLMSNTETDMVESAETVDVGGWGLNLLPKTSTVECLENPSLPVEPEAEQEPQQSEEALGVAATQRKDTSGEAPLAGKAGAGTQQGDREEAAQKGQQQDTSTQPSPAPKAVAILRAQSPERVGIVSVLSKTPSKFSLSTTPKASPARMAAERLRAMEVGIRTPGSEYSVDGEDYQWTTVAELPDSRSAEKMRRRVLEESLGRSNLGRDSGLLSDPSVAQSSIDEGGQAGPATEQALGNSGLIKKDLFLALHEEESTPESVVLPESAVNADPEPLIAQQRQSIPRELSLWDLSAEDEGKPADSRPVQSSIKTSRFSHLSVEVPSDEALPCLDLNSAAYHSQPLTVHGCPTGTQGRPLCTKTAEGIRTGDSTPGFCARPQASTRDLLMAAANAFRDPTYRPPWSVDFSSDSDSQAGSRGRGSLPGSLSSSLRSSAEFESGALASHADGPPQGNRSAPLRRSVGGFHESMSLPAFDVQQQHSAPLYRSSTVDERDGAEDALLPARFSAIPPALPTRAQASPVLASSSSRGQAPVRKANPFMSRSMNGGVLDSFSGELTGGTGRLSRSQSREQLAEEEERVGQLAQKIVDYYVDLEMKNMVVEDDEVASWVRINHVLDNIL